MERRKQSKRIEESEERKALRKRIAALQIRISKAEEKSHRYDGGCKVGWRYFRDKADAEAYAALQNEMRPLQEQLGYDWGYCWPGSITERKDKEGKVEFEVCTC